MYLVGIWGYSGQFVGIWGIRGLPFHYVCSLRLGTIYPYYNIKNQKGCFFFPGAVL